MAFVKARRLQTLPPYLFADIDRKKRQAIAAGKDVINLGIGDPDRPTPTFIIDRMADAIRDPANHPYPLEVGVPEFRQAARDYLTVRFGVELDPNTQLTTLIGSKEGLGHLPWAVTDPGDVVMVTQPGYPVLGISAGFAGCEVHTLPLTEASGWRPDLDAIDPALLDRCRLIYLNYPNNPTGAVADLDFFRKAVGLARRHDFVLCHDAAYCEMYYDAPPPSVLQADGAMDVAIELHSLSKTFNMTGWRIAFAAGNAEIVAALAQIKTNLDSGQFNAIQRAAAAGLRQPEHPSVCEQREVYRRRRDLLCAGLAEAGFGVTPPPATFYVWSRCPDGLDSMTTATRVLEEASVVLIPGVGFGPAGEGYVRAALTVEADRIAEAVERIKKIRW